MHFFSRRLAGSIITFMLLGLSPSCLDATPYIWNPPSGQNNLITAGNWSPPSGPPGSNDTTTFPDALPGPSLAGFSPALSAIFDIMTLTSQANTTGYTFNINSGGFLTINTNGAVTQAGSLPIVFNITSASMEFLNNASTNSTNFGGTVTYNVNTGGSIVFFGNSGVFDGYSIVNVTTNSSLIMNNTLGGKIVQVAQLNADPTTAINLNLSASSPNSNLIIGSNGATSTLQGSIFGNGAITKVGTGTLAITNTSNTYTTGTFLQAGTLQIAGDLSLGVAGTAPLTILGSGTTLQPTANFITMSRPLHLNNNILTIDGNGKTFSWNNIIDSTGSLGGLTVSDNTIFILDAGGNTYAGPTLVEGNSTLEANAAGALSPNSAITLDDTSKLIVEQPYSNTAFSLESASATSILNMGTGIIPSVLIINGGASTTFAGAVTGTGTLDLDGGTALTLTGTSNNGYTGAILLTNGTLTAGGTGTGTLPPSVVTLANSSELVNAGTNTITGLSSGSSSTQVDLGASPSVLTINGTGATTFAGAITDTGSLTLNGAYALTITNISNSYSGTTTIKNGCELIAGSGPNPTLSAASPVVLDGTGILNLNGANNTVASLTSTSTTSQVLLGAGTLTVLASPPVNSSFAGVIGAGGDTGGLTIDGGNQLTLTNTNLYTGPTTITTGQLVLSSPANNTIEASSGVTLGAGGMLELTTSNTISSLQSSFSTPVVNLGAASNVLTISGSTPSSFAGHINGPGSLALDMGQSLTLSGAGLNFYGGSTTLSNGSALIVVGLDVLPSTTDVTLNGTSTLTISTNDNTINSLSSGSTSSVVYLTAGTLEIGGATTTTYNGTFNGPGNLLIDGGNAITLGGTSPNFTGMTTISNATVTAAATDVLSASSSVYLQAGGTFALMGFDNSVNNLLGDTGSNISLGAHTLTINETSLGGTSFFGNISGPGGKIIKNGIGPLTLFGTSNSYSGGTTVNEGQLIGDTTSLHGNIALNNGTVGPQRAGVIFEQSGNGTYSGNISGPGYVAIDAPSLTVIFAGTNSYTLGTVIINGTLQGNTNSLQGNILANTGTTLVFNQAGAGTYSGVASGAGDFVKENSGTLTLSQQQLYTGTTSINGGTLQGSVANVIASSTSVSIAPGATFNLNGNDNTLNNLTGDVASTVLLGPNTLTVNETSPGIFQGNIADGGSGGNMTLTGGSTFTLTGSNGYQGVTTIQNGTLILSNTPSTIGLSSSVNLPTTQSVLQLTNDNMINNLSGVTGSNINLGFNILTVNQNSPGTYAGVIAGSGGALTKIGSDVLTLTGTNTYDGGTLVNGGTLQGNTNSLQGNIDINGYALAFDQGFNGIFNGTLQGIIGSTITKTGAGTLSINSSQASYNGETNINGGTLNLINTTMGGNVVINNTGFLTGNGTIGGNLTIAGGGTVSPGNSIGKIIVNGDYTQLPGSTYVWEVQGTGQSDLIFVDGSASLGGYLQVIPTGSFSLNTEYLVLHANGGVSGTFTDPPIPISAFIEGILKYDANDVFFAYNTALTQIAETFNQNSVAIQIDSITNPTPDETAILNSFLSLTTNQARDALDAMSGSQYTHLIPLARYANENFRDGIFNAVRNTLDPCWCPNPCDVVETWCRAEVGRYQNNGDTNCAGIHGYNWDITAGAHTPFSHGVLLGLAASYEANNVSFRQGGRTTLHTGQIAAYIVNRAKLGYFLGEGIYSCASTHYKRPINFGAISRTAKSNPYTSSGLIYGEAGINLDICTPIDCLIQPFVAAEYGIYKLSKLNEHGADSLDLTVKSHNQANFDTLLGVHFTSGVGPVDLYADIAWQHSFDRSTVNIDNTFEFGDTFEIKGTKFSRNGIIGDLRVGYQLTNAINIYAEVSGESWNSWTSYGVDIGINAWW